MALSWGEMKIEVRDGVGAVLVVVALGVLFQAIRELSGRDYLSAIVLVVTGLALVGAGVELLRPGVDG